MKTICWIAIAVLAIAFSALLARNQLVKMEVRRLLARQPGLAIEIGDVQTKWASTAVEAKDIRILNPPDFPNGTALEIRRIWVDFNPWSLLRRETRVRDMEIEIPRVTVVRNRHGDINLQRLGGSASTKNQASPAGPASAPTETPRPSAESQASRKKAERPLQIDQLRVRIETVTVEDYRFGETPATGQFDLAMDRVYTNLTSTKEVGDAIVSGVLERTVEQFFSGFIDSVKQALQNEELRGDLKRAGRELKRFFKDMFQQREGEPAN